jgi:hypothetical protein
MFSERIITKSRRGRESKKTCCMTGLIGKKQSELRHELSTLCAEPVPFNQLGEHRNIVLQVAMVEPLSVHDVVEAEDFAHGVSSPEEPPELQIIFNLPEALQHEWATIEGDALWPLFTTRRNLPFLGAMLGESQGHCG